MSAVRFCPWPPTRRATGDLISGDDQNDEVYGGQGDDDLLGGNGNDFVKTRDKVSGNDTAQGNANTDTCRVDAGDTVVGCEL